jgi:hypothetical protein
MRMYGTPATETGGAISHLSDDKAVAKMGHPVGSCFLP